MCLLSAGMERISPTSYKTKTARWTNGDGTTLEAGFWAPYQPQYSRAHKYAYVTRSFSTTYPYRYPMSLASKWRTFTFVCQRQACLSSQLLCSNGVCGYGRACDGVDGCGDRSDEANCRKCTQELNLIMITWNWLFVVVTAAVAVTIAVVTIIIKSWFSQSSKSLSSPSPSS